MFSAAPLPAAIATAEGAMAALIQSAPDRSMLLADASQISAECWASDQNALGRRDAATPETTAQMMRAAEQLRVTWGHYLGGMLYFESEWYWGIDRLHYLERRLFDLGCSAVATFAAVRPLPAIIYSACPATRRTQQPVLHFFCSLRSPYTYLAVQRCAKLAEHYGAELRLRSVLPMAMRGLPVPRDKRLYIVLDAKREAESLALPFGCIADPVGTPTERGPAVLHRAIAAGKGLAFLDSFMLGVWAEGVDAGGDAGLKFLSARARLDDTFVDAALGDRNWRAVAQANRDEMLSAGLWGGTLVPCQRRASPLGSGPALAG
jgi:2-hydroxychromene-2-carboxylate isomerase